MLKLNFHFFKLFNRICAKLQIVLIAIFLDKNDSNLYYYNICEPMPRNTVAITLILKQMMQLLMSF